MTEPAAPKQRIAFLVLAHMDAAQVERLAERLHPHRVFVHWDLKSPAVQFSPAITPTRIRYPTYWGGYSIVRATLELMRLALAQDEIFSKFVLLSGSCYPIRPVSDLVAMFDGAGSKDYIRAVRVDDSPFLPTMVERPYFLDGVLPYAVRRTTAGRVAHAALRRIVEPTVRPFQRRRTLDMTLMHGSQWWALTPATARHLVDTVTSNPAIERFYRLTYAPDEQIFQTIAHNTGFSTTIEPAMTFEGDGVHRTANLHLIHPSLTKWYGEADFDEIAASGRYFVRKVSAATSGRLMDMIDNTLLTGRRQRSFAGQ